MKGSYTYGQLRELLLPKNKVNYKTPYPDRIYTDQGEINIPLMEMLWLQREFVYNAKRLGFSDFEIQTARNKFIEQGVGLLSNLELLRLKAIPDEFNLRGIWSP